MRPLVAVGVGEFLDGDSNPIRRRHPGDEPDPDYHDRYRITIDAALSAARHRRHPAPAGAVMDMPVPDLRTLDGLRGYLPTADRAATSATRAFMDLDAALAAHANALEEVDRAEARFIAARRGVGAAQLTDALDAPQADDAGHDAAEGLGRYIDTTAPDRHRRHRGLGSRRRSFDVRQSRERRLVERVREAADHLHHAPAEACADIALKLAAVIAAGEAGPPDTTVFPWSWLRRLLADVVGLVDVMR